MAIDPLKITFRGKLTHEVRSFSLELEPIGEEL